MGALGAGDAEFAVVGLSALGGGELREAGHEARPIVTDAVEGRLRLVAAEGGALLARLLHRARPRRLAETVNYAAQPLDKVLDRRVRDAEPELPGGLRLQIVRLVHDEEVVVRQEGAADLQVGEEESVVDDEEVGGGGFLAGVAVEAGALPRAGAGREAARAHSLPRGGFGRVEPQFGAVAGSRLVEPDERLGEQARLVGGHRVAVGVRLPAADAQVVRLALELRAAEAGHVQPRLLAQRVQQIGNVFGDQLLLQVDRVGGNDDADIVAERVQGGGEEVGDGLADAGAAFDEEMARAVVPDCGVEGAGDGFRHRRLLGAGLVAREAPGERAAVRKERADLAGGERLGRIRRSKRSGALQPARDRRLVERADGPRSERGRGVGERGDQVGERAAGAPQQVGQAAERADGERPRPLHERKVDGADGVRVGDHAGGVRRAGERRVHGGRRVSG